MARLDIEGLQAGARVEMAEKRNVTDFALWKFSPTDEQRQMSQFLAAPTAPRTVFISTQKLPDYGRMARLAIEGLQAGARVEMAEKRNVTDFALWKFSPTDEQRQMEWDSPWGVGFPGWRIECPLVQLRQAARREKRWADADALRDQVRDLGYEIEDTAQGPQVRPGK